MIKKALRTDFDQQAMTTVDMDPSLLADDYFDYSKVVVRKPWGYEYLLYQNGMVAVWILYIKKGFQTSMHCHPQKKTSLVLLSGEAIGYNLSQETRLSVGDGLLIEKGVFHCTKSLSDDGVFVMEIEAPINKRDLIRLKDEYGRAGLGYETVEQMSYHVENYNYIRLIEPGVFYNVKKKFEECSIALATFNSRMEFLRHCREEAWSAVCLLKGSLQHMNSTIMEVGDTLDSDQILALSGENMQDGIMQEGIYSQGKVEVIIIKKKDTSTKASDYIVSSLEDEGIRDIFVVPGSANVHLLDSLGRNTNMNHICTQTEQAATMAAESYAKLTGKVGVVFISSGSSVPGALAGVADAWIDSTPLLVISGQSPRAQTITGSSLRQVGVQELDVLNLVKPITKYAVQIHQPDTLKLHLKKALHLAMTGRKGPVWIDLPIDLQGMLIDEEHLLPFNTESSVNISLAKLKKQVREVYQLLQQSQRPVILVGNGIRLAHAEQMMRELIAVLGIPVLTSKRGADLLPETHPLWYGRPGAYGQRGANFIIQNADLLLSVGCRLSLPLLGRNFSAFARGARRIIVDIDAQELQKPTIKADLAINCCAREFIQEMLNQKKLYTLVSCDVWMQKCRQWKEKYQREVLAIPGKGVNAYQVIDVLSQELQEDAIFTADGGSCTIFCMQRWCFKEGQRLILSTGLDTISFGFPGSIGACIAARKPVLCICEDRGFQKSIAELETIVKYQLPVKIVILNHQGYAYVQQTQKEYFGGRLVASRSMQEHISPDIEKIASAYNLPVIHIEQSSELKEKLAYFLNIAGPAICDVKIDEKQEIIPRLTFEVTTDGKWLARPLEDMYPFLEREEFYENMLIPAEGETADREREITNRGRKA